MQLAEGKNVHFDVKKMLCSLTGPMKYISGEMIENGNDVKLERF